MPKKQKAVTKKKHLKISVKSRYKTNFINILIHGLFYVFSLETTAFDINICGVI